METITINDFSGGVVENVSPTDFSPRQWAELKGFVPESDAIMQSQWPLQLMGSPTREGGLNNNTNFQGCQALATGDGLFIIAIRENGDLFYCKAPSPQAPHSTTAAVIWYPIASASGTYRTNPNIRFLTSLNFEAYKYVDNNDTDGGVTPAYLMGSRVWRTDTDGDGSADDLARVEQMVVVYYTGLSTAGDELKLACFPDTNRKLSSANEEDNVTFNATAYTPSTAGVSITSISANGSLVTYTTATNHKFSRGYPVTVTGASQYNVSNRNIVATPSNNQFTVVSTATGSYGGGGTATSSTLVNYPYTYLDADNTLLPGRGVLPNANVGASWNNALILGDVYWKREKADNTVDKDIPDTKVVQALNPSNTTPYEGSIYFSADDVDKFDPRALINLTAAGSELRGLHVVNDTLIAITSYGGEADGIIALRGNPGQLIRYDGGTANPYAVRRDLLRGGVGMPSRSRNTTNGVRGGSCVWPDAGLVVFIDKMGGVYYTNGESVGRLDEYGPCEPSAITNFDHVGATNKHLFVWRNQRMWCLTLLGVDGAGDNTACWTELVLPDTPTSVEDVKTMTGGREELYFVWKGAVWRYATEGPEAERGRANNVPLTLTASTRTVAVDGSVSDPLWHRFGMTFETPTSCTVGTVRIQSVGAKKRNLTTATTGLIATNKVGHTTWTLNRTFLNENEGEFIVPAGIGAQSEASATITFTGNVVLETATFWVSGARPNRGEVPA